jgi:hypothetical protein
MPRAIENPSDDGFAILNVWVGLNVERHQCLFIGQDGDSVGWIRSSRVKSCVRRRMMGAANSTIGSIMIQATNDDRSQWIMKVPLAMKGKLAIPAAIAQVRPD